jgi:threonine dehydratase
MTSTTAVAAASSAAVDRDAIAAMYARIRPHLRRTPAVGVDGRELGAHHGPLVLKLESLQHGGSFKARGAFAHLATRALPPAGVAAASGGNHGVAVALAAQRLGVPAAIFVPTTSSPAKVARIRAAGARLESPGTSYNAMLAATEAYAASTGALSVHAFDQEETILGQGTVALELLEQEPDVDTILAPVGGSGLVAGIAAWCAGRVRVVGVEPELAPTLAAALAAGEPVDAPEGGIAADALAPRRVGRLPFEIARRHVERVVLVSDSAIADAQQAMWDVLRVVAEPAGATALAALRSGAYVPAAGERVAVVVSGGNTSAVDFGAR